MQSLTSAGHYASRGLTSAHCLFWRRRQAALERLLIDEPRARYDLEAEPGVRVALVRLNPREHAFILMMHHIICDWASEGIIWRELSAVYRSFLTGEPVSLPAHAAITHGDYVMPGMEGADASHGEFCRRSGLLGGGAARGSWKLPELPSVIDPSARPLRMSFQGAGDSAGSLSRAI